MSQSSPSDPRPSRRSSPAPNQRVLRRPHERYYDSDSPPPQDAEGGSPAVPGEAGGVEHDPFVRLPAHSHGGAPAASEEQMEMRHLPPAERRRRAGSRRRATPSGRSHRRRAAVERDFAIHARSGKKPSARKPRSAKWGKALRRLGAVALFAALAIGTGFALTSPQFKIRGFQIVGANSAPSGEVASIANQLVGQNILRVRTRPIETQLRALPAVESVHIKRMLAWPPRAAIVITERTPLTKVGSSGLWWVVDAAGVPFRAARADSEADRGLYAITGPSFAPQAGKPLPAADWKKAIQLVADLRSSEQNGGAPWHLRRIQFDATGGVSLRVLNYAQAPIEAAPAAADGAGAPAPGPSEIWLRLGDDRWDEKLVRARQAMDYFRRTGRHAAALDLVSFDRPLWTPQGAVTTVANPAGPGNSPAPLDAAAADTTTPDPDTNRAPSRASGPKIARNAPQSGAVRTAG